MRPLRLSRIDCFDSDIHTLENNVLKTCSSAPSRFNRDSVANVEIVLYKKRFSMLLVLSLAMFAIGEMWLTFGSITEESRIYFNTTEANIDWFGNIYLLAFAAEFVPCTVMPQILGLKWTITFGCILDFIGATLRLISLAAPNLAPSVRYGVALFGNLVYGAGQGFILNMPGLLSEQWFGDNERSISTSIPYMSNTVGNGLGYLDIFVVNGGKRNVNGIGMSLLYIAIAEIVLHTIVLTLAITVLRERPKTPSSKAQALLNDVAKKQHIKVRDRITFGLKNMVKVLKNKQSILLLYIFSAYYSNYTSLYILLSAIVENFIAHPIKLTGYMGAIGLIMGGFLTVVIGFGMEKTKNKHNCKIGAGVQFICGAALAIILILILTNKLDNTSLFILAIFWLSFCTPYISIGCEILAENTYPLDPNISSNEALVFGNIFGFVVTLILGQIPGKAKYFTAIGLAIIFYFINGVLLLAVKFSNKREVNTSGSVINFKANKQ